MDTKTVVISVQVKTSSSKFESVVNNKIEKVHTGSSFEIIFNDCVAKYDIFERVAPRASLNVHVSAGKDGEEFDIDADGTVAVASEIVDVKRIRFVVEKVALLAEIPGTSGTSQSINDALMRGGRKLPQVSDVNKKTKIHNQVLCDAQKDSRDELLRRGYSTQEGTKKLELLTKALYYLDGRSAIINSTAKKKNLSLIPER